MSLRVRVILALLGAVAIASVASALDAVPSSPPTAFPTSLPTARPTAAPTTAAPSSAPTTAVPVAAPTPVPTTATPTFQPGVPTPVPTGEPSARPTLSPTRVPTSTPTPVPTISVSTLQVRAGVPATATLDSRVDLEARLANASSNTTIEITARSMTADDLTRLVLADVQTPPCRLPPSVYPITGVSIDSDFISEPLVVGINLEHVMSYEAAGRHVLSCSFGGDWVPPRGRCVNLGFDASALGPTSDGLLRLSVPLCEPAFLLVVDLDTRARWCAPGLHGCDCSSTSAVRNDAPGGLYVAGLTFLGLAHLVVLAWFVPKARAWAAPVAAFCALLALSLLLCAAAVDDPRKGDPDAAFGQSRAASVRGVSIFFQAVALACAVSVAASMRAKGDGYSLLGPIGDASGEERWWSPLASRRVLLALAYVALTVQLSIALALTGPRSRDAWAGPPLIVAPALTVLALLDKPDTPRVVIGMLAVALGSFYTAAHVYQRACGARYGSDQPSVSVF